MGLLLACAKYIEKGEYFKASKLRMRDGWLRKSVPSYISASNAGDACFKIREEAAAVSRQIIASELSDLSNNPPEDSDERTRVKENIFRKIKKLAPGGASTIDAMQDASGKVVTSPEEIAEVLRSHWGKVFSEKQVDTTALQIWMEELFIKDENGLYLTGLPSGSSLQWVVKRKHVGTAIKCAKNSMPGPDGIPVAAYRYLGDLGIDILFDVIRVLCTEEGKPMLESAYADRSSIGEHSFNSSLLCCLPKKVAGTDPDSGAFYTGDTTRPLALVNTDNRVLASAARHAWEHL